MPRNKIAVFDRYGNAVAASGGVPIYGPAIGARNISYVPEGAIVSGVGTASFEVPLQFAQNNAIVKGSQIMIYQDDVPDGPVFWGRVIRRPRSLSRDGTYVSVQLEDVLAELASVTVTSGFVSKPLELASAMLQRLVARQTETQWTVRNTLTSTGYASFSAYGIEVLRAIGKYAGEHFASYKRETYLNPVTGAPQRRVVIGQFSNIVSGIRIIEAPREWGSVPNEKKPAEIRVIKSASFDDDNVIVNRLIPYAGNDINAASITLAPLYGVSNFVGYNAKYPVKARLREDIIYPTALPGQAYPLTPQYYEFYIEDTASITANRLSEIVYPRTDITPLSTNPTDLTVAATTLYAESVQYLLDHITPHLSLSITTDHRGDLRNIGGTQVYVRCRAKNKEGDYVLEIDGNYRVQKVEISNADSTGDCNWTLSSDGRGTESDAVLFTGALEDIDYLKKAPTILLGFPIYPIDDVLDVGHNIKKTFVNSNAFISTGQVILDLRFDSVRSALRPLSHTHTVDLPAHSHSVSIAAHSHSFSVSAHVHAFSVPDHSHSLTESDHAHGVTVASHAHSASNGDHDHTMAIGSHSHAVIGTKPFIDLKAVGAIKFSAVGKNGENVVTDVQATAGTADHTHGQTAASGASGVDAASGGGFAIGTSGSGGISQNTGSGGGFSGSTSGSGGASGNTGSGGSTSTDTGSGGGFSGATGGAGGLSSATGTSAGAEWGLTIGPKPAIIDIWLNTKYIGRFTTDLRVDVTSSWNTNKDNVLEVASLAAPSNLTGLGRLTGAVVARMVGTTLANQTLL